MWEVTYDVENKALTSEAAKEEIKAFEMDPREEKFQERSLKAAALYGDEALEKTKKDLETAKFWYNKETFNGEEIFEAGAAPLKMIVVRLNGGSLLLYAPVRIRDEVGFGDWLDSLGPVEWLVVAASGHTLNIQAVAEKYPEAKIIGAPSAEAKLNYVNALVRNRFDYNCTDTDDLKAVNDILETEGVKLYFVEGDVACHTIVAVAHKIALSCDLVYGHHDGEGLAHLKKELFWDFKPEHWEYRLFKYAMISKPNTPHGFLPNYRYQMMDLSSLGAMQYEQPAKDGSSCDLMAKSLRAILRLEFDTAIGVHIGVMTREDYRKNVDAAWNWLDGYPLI